MNSVQVNRCSGDNRNISAKEECEYSDPVSMGTTSSDLTIFTAGLVIGLTAGLLGVLFGRPKMKRDVLLLAVLTLYFCRQKVLDLLPSLAYLPSEAYILLVLLLLFNGMQVVYLHNRKDTEPSPDLDMESPSPLRPFIFPASTSHSRFFPRHHSFKYSYFLVGVPVGWRGSINNLLSCDVPGPASWWKTTWLSVHSEDYLFYTRPCPGSQAPSLREKLDAYLRSEDADPAFYPHAYLVTAPRALGFSFNPVSFWYLYDDDIRLKAMILEVNNTFGERRMYLMREEDSDDDELGQVAAREKEILLAELPGLVERRTKKFKSKWDKDFHVSPFNDREGIYSLTAIDPFANGIEEGNINNVITLSSPPYQTLHPEPITSPVSSASPNATSSPPLKTKLVASISSIRSLNPTILTSFQKYTFLLQYIWKGFLTNPRILVEAWKLWWKGLKVWYRPEVSATTVGREETEEETMVEEVFEVWLRQVATRDTRLLNYSPAAGGRRGQLVVIKGCADDKAEDGQVSSHEMRTEKETKTNGEDIRGEAKVRTVQDEELEIRILTPAFYSELVRSPDFRKVWEERCFIPEQGEAMVWTNDKQALEDLIDSEIKRCGAGDDKARKVGDEVDRLGQRKGMSTITLRLGTALIGTFGYNKHRDKQDSVKTALSFADIINAQSCSFTSSSSWTKQLEAFNRASFHIHSADSYALGSTALVRFYGSLLSIGLVWLAARQLSVIVMDDRIFRPAMALDIVAIFGLIQVAMLMTLVGIRSFSPTEYTYA